MPCLDVNPNLVFVEGGSVEIYEYEDIESTIIAVERVDPNSFEAVMIEFESYFHYFKGSQIVVRYIGDDAEVIAVLESAFGPQFANDTARITYY